MRLVYDTTHDVGIQCVMCEWTHQRGWIGKVVRRVTSWGVLSKPYKLGASGGVPKVLNMPKNLVGVVAATTGCHVIMMLCCHVLLLVSRVIIINTTSSYIINLYGQYVFFLVVLLRYRCG